MARQPKPTHLKIVQGNPGKRALNKNEPIPDGDLGKAPSYMTKNQKAEWNYVLKHAPAGLLKMIDTVALEVYVIAKCLHREAAEKLQTEDLVVLAGQNNTPTQNPLVGMMNKQAELMLKSAAQMGFTPASRSRVSMPEKGPESGFDEFA